MAQAGAVVYYIAIAAMAAGEIYQAKTTAENEERRIKALEDEKKSAKLAVLDEEVNRLRLLNEANADIIANAGNIDPFTSPSLIAARRFNFKMFNEDVSNLYSNLAAERANISAMIAISRSNIKSAKVSGLLGAVSTMADGMMTGQKTFSKSTPTTPTPITTKSKSKSAGKKAT